MAPSRAIGNSFGKRVSTVTYFESFVDEGGGIGEGDAEVDGAGNAVALDVWAALIQLAWSLWLHTTIVQCVSARTEDAAAIVAASAALRGCDTWI